MNPTFQRAYLYLVALVAVHMIVLGAANLMRVLAELALGAPSQTFIGLPFLFAEGRSAPSDMHREHASLAIALLLVGIPAWLIHWRAGQRAAARDPEERASAWRGVYLHVVIFVTVLVLAAHAAFAATHVVRGLMDPAAFDTGRLGGLFDTPIVDEHWDARAIGMLAMVLAAAVAWRYHSRWSELDRAAGVGGRVETIRASLLHLTLLVGGLLGLQAIAEAGTWVIHSFRPEAALPFSVPEGPPVEQAPPPPGREFDPQASPPPRRPVFLERPSLPVAERLTDRIPAGVAFAAVWITHWIRAGRGRSRADAIRTGVRGLYLYAALVIAGIVTLPTLGATLRRLIRAVLDGTPGPTLAFDIGFQLPMALVFGTAWLFHRIVAARESDLATERTSAREARRVYLYGFALLGVAIAAFGAAGLIGVAGSYVLGDQTHQSDEIATYVALVLLGLPTWGHHWRTAQAQVQVGGEPERRARWRRVTLSLGVLGGVVAALAFGSGAVFRVVNAVLAFELGTTAAHDLWHLLSDTAVGAAVALFHWRALRADRAMLAGTPMMPAASPVSPALLFVLEHPDARARERIVAAAGEQDLRVYEADPAVLAELLRRLG